MNARDTIGRRKPAPAFVRLCRLAAVRWLEWSYGRALRKRARLTEDSGRFWKFEPQYRSAARKITGANSRVRRLAKRRTRARVALYDARGIL